MPNTVAWLRGLTNVRGSLVPVVDAAAALGVAHQSGVPPYLLIFGQGDTAMGMLIDGLPRLLSLNAVERLFSDVTESVCGTAPRTRSRPCNKSLVSIWSGGSRPPGPFTGKPRRSRFCAR